MEIHIDCATIDSRAEFHWVLARELGFPDWYGHNLDALHDQLTAITGDTRLILTNWDHVAPFSRGFRQVLEDTGEENPYFRVTFL